MRVKCGESRRSRPDRDQVVLTGLIDLEREEFRHPHHATHSTLGSRAQPALRGASHRAGRNQHPAIVAASPSRLSRARQRMTAIGDRIRGFAIGHGGPLRPKVADESVQRASAAVLRDLVTYSRAEHVQPDAQEEIAHGLTACPEKPLKVASVRELLAADAIEVGAYRGVRHNDLLIPCLSDHPVRGDQKRKDLPQQLLP